MSENTNVSIQSTGVVSSFVNPGAYINPWMRFFARTLDILLFTTIIVFVYDKIISHHLMSVMNQMPQKPSASYITYHVFKFFSSIILLQFSAPFWWCLLIEPVLLSTWGSTPGKFLFNLHVTHTNGDKLGFKEALQRSMRVWCFGMGLGIPLVSVITYIVAYVKLTKHGATSWDKNLYFVKHEACGWFRKTLITIIYIIPLGLWVLLAIVMLLSGLLHL